MKKGKKKKVMLVFGTRPEAIKMAPVILELQKNEDVFNPYIVVTGQHRHMLDQVLDAFGITSHHDLNIMAANQSLDHILTSAHVGIAEILDTLQPDLVLVQGDTTTALAASQAAYHRRIPLGHIEAGLRSFDKYNPFPEEINRTITDSIADFCFAPTEVARTNLLRAGVTEDKIFVTGNTVVDALIHVTKKEYAFENQELKKIDFKKRKIVLLTAHRRENYLTGGIKNIIASVNALVQKYPNLEIILPLHLNPNVREAINKTLRKNRRIHAIEPLCYKDMVKVLQLSYLILTDSGGIQEEAPTFGKPVLVLRKVTERPEGIATGVAKLVGTQKSVIMKEVERLLTPEHYTKMAQAKNPYGDGTAAKKIIRIIKEKL